MQSNLPPLRTTRLENVSLEPDAASFDLDGKTVSLAGHPSAPSVAALHAFHQSALADYRARSHHPGLFSRLRAWLGGIFGRSTPSAEIPHRGTKEEPAAVAPPPGQRQTRPP